MSPSLMWPLKGAAGVSCSLQEAPEDEEKPEELVQTFIMFISIF